MVMKNECAIFKDIHHIYKIKLICVHGKESEKH